MEWQVQGRERQHRVVVVAASPWRLSASSWRAWVVGRLPTVVRALPSKAAAHGAAPRPDRCAGGIVDERRATYGRHHGGTSRLQVLHDAAARGGRARAHHSVIDAARRWTVARRHVVLGAGGTQRVVRAGTRPALEHDPAVLMALPQGVAARAFFVKANLGRALALRVCGRHLERTGHGRGAVARAHATFAELDAALAERAAIELLTAACAARARASATATGTAGARAAPAGNAPALASGARDSATPAAAADCAGTTVAATARRARAALARRTRTRVRRVAAACERVREQAPK